MADTAAWDEMIQGLLAKLKVDAGAIYEPELFGMLEAIYTEDPRRWEQIKAVLKKLRISTKTLIAKFQVSDEVEVEVFETPFMDLGDGSFAEMVVQDGIAKFAVYDPSKNTIGYVIELSTDGIKVVPPTNDEIFKKGYVTLPSVAEEYGTEIALYKEIKAFIHKYMEVSEDYESIAAFYPLLSWVADVMNVIAYLRAKGDWGVGKSRFMTVFMVLCYRSIATTGAMSDAPIYRIMDKWKGTMIVDEGDMGKSKDSKAAMEKILVCGFERNKPIIRCNPNEPSEVNVFDPFGAKIIATRYAFSDKALESRCLTEIMKESTRSDIPIELPPEFYEEALHLRNKLLMYRFRNRAKIKARSEKNDMPIDLSSLPKRLQQAARPISVVIADHPELLSTLRSFMETKAKQMVAEAAETVEGHMVQVLNDNIILATEENNAYEWDLTYKELLDPVRKVSGNYKISLSLIKSRGASLGLKTNKRMKNTVLKRRITCEKPLFQNLMRRYIPEQEPESEPEKSVYPESPSFDTEVDGLDKVDANIGGVANVCV